MVVVSNESSRVVPNPDSLSFDGPIYLLQDENVFSAAGSLVWMAIHSEQLINVGLPTGRLLGRGLEPRFFVLPESQLIFGLELVMDATHARTARDVYHDRIELRVEPTVEDLRARVSTSDPYHLEFLSSHDPWIAAVRAHDRSGNE